MFLALQYTIDNIFLSIDAVAYPSAHYGGGTGSIFMDNVNCAGTESRLDDCTHSSGSAVTCSSGHNEDAGVRCQCM